MDEKRSTRLGVVEAQRLIHRMLRYGKKYIDQGAAVYELKHRELQVHQLKRKAASLGCQVAPIPAAA